MRFGILTAMLLLAGAPVFAALGGDVTSIDADRVHAKGALLRITQADRYSMHEIRTAAGTSVREYVSSSGKVFAVAWQGQFLPDFQQVLGTYFTQYQQASERARRARHGRGPLSFQDGDLVVQMGGHQRSFSGRAYVTGLMPAGVDASAIQ